jgi:hypothetical protein
MVVLIIEIKLLIRIDICNCLSCIRNLISCIDDSLDNYIQARSYSSSINYAVLIVECVLDNPQLEIINNFVISIIIDSISKFVEVFITFNSFPTEIFITHIEGFVSKLLKLFEVSFSTSIEECILKSSVVRS